MAITVDGLYREALCLSNDSRIDLAERLLESLDFDPAAIELQMVTVRRRLEEIETGRVQPIPGPEGLQRVRDAVTERPLE
jgi:putative addiction module component (TIGR02574 family)